MNAKHMKAFGVMSALLAVTAAGCGEVSRNGRAPAMVVIESLTAASGAEPGDFVGTLHSDVITLVTTQIDGEEVKVPTVFSDPAQVTMRLQLRDPGGVVAAQGPSPLNDVTFNRYRVTYRRADGRNTPGVDVPYPMESAITFTVPATGSAQVGFTIVRHSAKQEAPLQALGASSVIITTMADVTFYGHDLAGNEVMATGTIGVFFGNFGDPD